MNELLTCERWTELTMRSNQTCPILIGDGKIIQRVQWINMTSKGLEVATCFSSCALLWKVLVALMHNFFFLMFYSYPMLRFRVKPFFTPFQRLVLRLLKVAPSQLNLNAWLMMVDFEYLCQCGRELQPSLFILFFFFTYSLWSKTSNGHIYFIQRLNVTHVFDKMPLFYKGWKDMFFKVGQRIENKLSCWMTHARNLAFPLKWSKMEKNNYKYPILELSIKDHMW